MLFPIFPKVFNALKLFSFLNPKPKTQNPQSKIVPERTLRSGTIRVLHRRRAIALEGIFLMQPESERKFYEVVFERALRVNVTEPRVTG